MASCKIGKVIKLAEKILTKTLINSVVSIIVHFNKYIIKDHAISLFDERAVPDI